MPDGGLVSTKGIKHSGEYGIDKGVMLNKITKRAVLNWNSPSFMRKPLRYKESKIGKTISQGFCFTSWHFYERSSFIVRPPVYPIYPIGIAE